MNDTDAQSFVRCRAAFLTLAFPIVLFSLWRVCADEPLFSGSESYARAASAILTGGSIPDAYRPPGYPLLLAAAQSVSSDWRVLVLLLQLSGMCMAGLLLIGMMRRLGRSAWEQALFSLFFAGNLLLLIEAATLRETMMYALLIAAVPPLALALRERPPCWIAAVGLGTVCGTAHLIRPTGLTVSVLIIGLLMLWRVRPGRIAAVLLAFVVVVTPWQIMVSSFAGKPTLSSSLTSELNLWKGNNRYFWSLYPTTDLDALDAVAVARRRGREITQISADAELGREAREFILNDPAAFAGRAAVKTLVFFSPFPWPRRGGIAAENEGRTAIQVREGRTRAHALELIALVHGSALIGCAALGMLCLWREGNSSRACAAVAAALLAAHLLPYMIAFSETRFRLALDPILSVLAAAGACSIIRCGVARTAAAGVALMLAAVQPVFAADGPQPARRIPAFPGAMGFGSDTPGGSGRGGARQPVRAVTVRTLEDSGAGSLRECAEGSGARICVFERAGVIRLKKALKIREPYLTIAGESAPDPGVMLRGAGIEISTHDVIVRHLEIRIGDDLEGPNPASRDGMSIGSSESEVFGVVVDHVSISWAIDENFTVWGERTHDVTLSNSIIAEGLNQSIHPKGAHSKGVMISERVRRVSLHHNLITSNHERNPYLKPGTIVEVVNNVVYNWGSSSRSTMANLSDTGGLGLPVLAVFAGNLYRPGPQSFIGPPLWAKPAVDGSRVYVESNKGPTSDGAADEWAFSALPAVPHRARMAPFERSPISVNAPDETFEAVLARAGSRPRLRSAVDQRLIQEVRDRTGSIKDCMAGCDKAVGAWPAPAGTAHKLDLSTRLSSNAKQGGYTAIEVLLHRAASAVE